MDGTSLFAVAFTVLLLWEASSVNHNWLLSRSKIYSARPDFSTSGDVVIGIISLAHTDASYTKLNFKSQPEPETCKGFFIKIFQNILAIPFAFSEVQKDHSLLPNITLGLQLYDSCLSPVRALKGVLSFLSGSHKLVPNFGCHSQSSPFGIIGAMTTPESEPIAQVLSLYRFPQISHGSQHSKFSDRIQFPSFLRTVPSKSHLPYILTQLLVHFNWTWVGLVSFINEEIEMELALEKHLAKAGGCLALSKRIHDLDLHLEIHSVAKEIGKSSARVFICHGYHSHFKLLADALLKQSITSKLWVLTTNFAVIPEIFTSEMLSLLNGSLDLGIHSDKIAGFENFLTTIHPSAYPSSHLVKFLWQKLFKCIWPGTEKTEGVIEFHLCTGAEKMAVGLFDLNSWIVTYQAYLAARAYITAYQDMMTCTKGKGPFLKGSCATAKGFQPWQAFHYVKNINFTFSSKEIFFKNGEVPAAFDIMNLQISPNGSLQVVNIGQFHSGSLVIQDRATVWGKSNTQIPQSFCTKSCLPGYSKIHLQGKPSCCHECRRCPNGQFASVTDSANCWKCPPGQWPNHLQDRCLPTIYDFLSFTEPLGAALAICSSLLFILSSSILCIFILYHHTPIVKANNRALSYLLLTSLSFCFLCPMMFLGRPSLLTCSLRQAAFGLVFAVCLSATLAKTITVVMAFRASKPGSYWQKWMGYKLPGAITVCCPLAQAVVCFLWIMKWPPVPTQNPLDGGALVTLECDRSHLEFFYIMLGYLGLLATISLGVAFPARHLPTSFNEAQHISMSMLIFTFVWISFVPSYLSATRKYVVAMEIFAILASGAGLLVCLFFPKCYIILLQPERNNRNHLLRRQLPYN